MAARVIPFAQNLSAKNISITPNDAQPEGGMLQATQDAVTFTNNSGYPIDIAFTPSGVFTDITGLSPTSPNNVNTQSAPTNGAANYFVTVHNPGGTVVNGPYSIQAGSGFMVVSVGANLNCTPDPVAIPVGGRLELRPTIVGRYDVSWSNGNPLNITTVDSTPHTATGGAGQFPYSVAQHLAQATGGGKVVIQNT
jgi:hypothetical protein